MFSTPETSVHVQHKNREISPLQREREREERLREKGKGKERKGEKVSFKTRMEDPVRHADYRISSSWIWPQLHRPSPEAERLFH